MPDTSNWLGGTGTDWHTRALADPDQGHFVGLVDDEIVGFATLAGLEGSGPIELRRMVVRPDRRGMGHGRALLEAAVASIREVTPTRRIWLDVKRTNTRARALYESAGFVPAAGVPPFADADSVAELDLVVMVNGPDADPRGGPTGPTSRKLDA
ncbi:Ribosomal protein S18 acetylase RimI [Cryptosporangium aurantiacum]|uniref:Ribosomal protein S18 acetylase RimI n=2 Tax=Cryptosporangium aurantiacum TaxID=134849 RepID=A0A1M7RP23_9ACTN|nr:Ribosomal protein S18 acetylase RimI [Cryptosporangium aurantiacum]